jgi:ubiquinone/menaquinone biosynthesis C-methylase UbiE
MDSSPPITVPNHHAGHPGFAGASGLVAAMSMLVGRAPMAELAADLIGLTADDRLVDVGCGPGAAARLAGRRGVQVTGVDPARVMRRVAAVVPAPGRGRCTWVEGVAESLPLPDGAATALWSLSCAHHWADVDRALGEARRVLRPGGRLLVIERQRDPEAAGLASHGWASAQADAFAQRCAGAGFADPAVSTHEIGHGSVLAVLATRP